MCTFRANRGGDPGKMRWDSGPYYGQLTVEVTIWPLPRIIVQVSFLIGLKKLVLAIRRSILEYECD